MGRCSAREHGVLLHIHGGTLWHTRGEGGVSHALVWEAVAHGEGGVSVSSTRKTWQNC